MKLHLTHPIRLFSTPARAWTALGIYTVLLYSTLDLVLQAYLWVFERLGEASVAGLLNGVYAAVGLVLLLLLRPRRLGAFVTLLLICAGLAVFFQQLQQPSNRLHFLQYGPLTLLAFDALRFHCRDRYHYVWTMFLVTCIGLGDETAQIFTGRQFDVYDLLLNSMSALFVLALIGFVVEPEGADAKKRASQNAEAERNP